MTGISRRRAEAGLTLPRFYPIIDSDLCDLRGFDPLRLADACAAGGATLVQVRQKASGSGAFFLLIREVVARLASVGGAVVVNDRADLAAMAHAAGVHVGQQDLEPRAVRTIVGPDLIIGLSTHTTAQVDEATAQEVDYIAVGPVFRTNTKDTGYAPRGLELVDYAARMGRPVVAIGGITLENAPDVIRAGASSVAVISDLFADADPATRVRRYVEALARA